MTESLSESNRPEPHDHRRAVRRALAGLAVLVAGALVWRFTPLAEWLTAARVAGWVALIPDDTTAALAVAAAFVLGSLIMIPQTVLTLGAVIAFGPLEGAVYAYLGTLLAAAVTYLVGRELGSETMRRLGGTRIDRVSRYLSHRGIRTMTVVSVLPLAPFTLVNMVAGASHIRFWDYFAGTALGIWTGIAAIAVFGAQLERLLQHPNATNFITAAAVASVLLLAGYYLQHRLRRYFENGRGG